ncbi:MAG: hypothetical protein M1828_004691 [Chrysothrix sp. TS-e1954]|nr:MAG: hypothetical protein M1828_004691 [Chrysothrix sp. TS-e1954]
MSTRSLVALATCMVFYASLISSTPVRGLQSRAVNQTAIAEEGLKLALASDKAPNFDQNPDDINSVIEDSGSLSELNTTLGAAGSVLGADVGDHWLNLTASPFHLGSARVKRDMSGNPVQANRIVTYIEDNVANAVSIAAFCYGRSVGRSIIQAAFVGFTRTVTDFVATNHIDMSTEVDHSLKLSVAAGNGDGDRFWTLTLGWDALYNTAWPPEEPRPTWSQVLQIINGLEAMLLAHDRRMIEVFTATVVHAATHTVRLVNGRFGLM